MITQELLDLSGQQTFEWHQPQSEVSQYSDMIIMHLDGSVQAVATECQRVTVPLTLNVMLSDHLIGDLAHCVAGVLAIHGVLTAYVDLGHGAQR